MIRCPNCGHAYRWRPAPPCEHLLAARWVLVDFARRQYRTRRRWLHPAAGELQGYLDGLTGELLRDGKITVIDDEDAAAIAGLRFEEANREHRWNEEWWETKIFLFANSNAEEWLGCQITQSGSQTR